VVRGQFHRKREGTSAWVRLHKGNEVPDELILIKGGAHNGWGGVNSGCQHRISGFESLRSIGITGFCRRGRGVNTG